MNIEIERAEYREIRALLRLESLSLETVEREAQRLIEARRRMRRYGLDVPPVSPRDSERIALRVRGIRPLSRFRMYPSHPIAV